MGPRCPDASTVRKIHEAIGADFYLAPHRGLPGWCGLFAWIGRSVQKWMYKDHAPAEPHSDYHLKHYSAVTYKTRACSCLIVVAMVSGNRFRRRRKACRRAGVANDRCPRRRGRAGDPRWTATLLHPIFRLRAWRAHLLSQHKRSRDRLPRSTSGLREEEGETRGGVTKKWYPGFNKPPSSAFRGRRRISGVDPVSSGSTRA